MFKSLKRKMLALFSILFSALALTSCKGENRYGLEGIEVIWTPVVWIWSTIFKWFTPKFWGFVWNIVQSGMPIYAKIFVGLIVFIFAAIIYLTLVILCSGLATIFTLVIAIVWIIVAILNGIFHFDSNLFKHFVNFSPQLM